MVGLKKMFLTRKKTKKLYFDKKDNLFFVCVFVYSTEEKKLVYERVLKRQKAVLRLQRRVFFTAPGARSQIHTFLIFNFKNINSKKDKTFMFHFEFIFLFVLLCVFLVLLKTVFFSEHVIFTSCFTFKIR